MAKYKLGWPFFDGSRVHERGTVLIFPEGGAPPTATRVDDSERAANEDYAVLTPEPEPVSTEFSTMSEAAAKEPPLLPLGPAKKGK